MSPIIMLSRSFSIPLARRALCLALCGAGALAQVPPASAATTSSGPLVHRADAGVHPVQGTDRIIVHYRDTSTGSGPSAAQLQSVQQAGNQMELTLRHHRRMAVGADVFRAGRRLSTTEARTLIDALRAADANIDYAEPDARVYPLADEADPYLGNQWNIWEFGHSVWAPWGWGTSTGDGTVIAVIDTGVLPHPDLQANLLSGYDFITDVTNANDGDARDADATDPGDGVAADVCGSGTAASNSSWHGTHVAGIAAAIGYNGLGVIGVAYNAKVMPVRALGRCGGYVSDIADAIYWAAGGSVSGVPVNTTPARVINLSLGASAACPTTFQTAITRARALGASVVVAAGNDAQDASGSTPANCSGVIAVAATARSGGRASYSNYGSTVTLAAPGGDWGDGIWSTYNDGAMSAGNMSYAPLMGTSMAAPHVSGVIALMLSANRNLVPDQVTSLLQSSASPLGTACAGCGAGLVNAWTATQAALKASSTPATVTEVEPNNALSSAQVIASTLATVSGTISSNTDVDYYKVNVNAGARVVATLTTGASINDDLYAYDAYGRQVAYSVNGAGTADTVTLTNTGTTMAAYYLRIVRNTGSTGAYVLTLTP